MINFLRHILFDGYNSRINREHKKLTQFYSFLPLYLDRLIETLRFYPIDMFEFLKISLNYGLPNGDKFKDKFIKTFGPSDPKNLLDSYRELDKHYALRLMLTYHRIDFIEPYLKLINKYFLKRKLRILDYGCGVSDIGLYFAKTGHDVTLVDIDTPKFMFTKIRFKKRSLPFSEVTLKSTESLPKFNGKFDLIIATEILEHYRYPIKLVNLFHRSLKNGGLLLNSLGLDFARENGADHLDESLFEGNSPEYKHNYQTKFRLITIPRADPWLFMKK